MKRNRSEDFLIQGYAFYVFLVLFSAISIFILFFVRQERKTLSLKGDSIRYLPVRFLSQKKVQVSYPAKKIDSGTVQESPVTQNAVTGSEGIEDIKNNYIAMILQKIESKKQYPKVELYLEKEGYVRTRIVIQKNGHLERLEILEGTSKNFIEETKQTIHRALPFPPFPEEMQNQERIEIPVILKYTLERR